jgi:hypothetical protein
MSNGNSGDKRRRGRPPGSKNKKRASKLKVSQPKIEASIEATIRHLLDLPTTTETKLKLIKAALE